MKCQRCESGRLATINAKCSDLCSASYKEFRSHGYVPSDLGIGGGDYIEMQHCLDCGQIQGPWPVPEPDTSEDSGWDVVEES